MMGPPGAGKGTQGELLASRFNVPRYATGDILRAADREGTELGQAARKYMDAGELVPDELIIELVGEALGAPAAMDGYLLDGFPRTVAQAVRLEALVRNTGRDLDAVVNLVVSDDEIVRRLSSRRVCSDCGTLAPTETLRTECPECPACGGELITRPDDRPETVRRRLEVYREQTEPVLAWYRESGMKVLDIRGTGDVECVQVRILAGLV